MSRLQKIGLYLLIFAVILVPIMAISPTDNPSPIVHVDYSPQDAPITIQQATLTYPSGFIIHLGHDTQNGFQYEFPINTYLFPGVYDLSIIAKDSDENMITVNDTFEILQPPTNIWIVNPDIYYFEDGTQNIAIGQNLPFILQAQTKVPATCRIKKFFPPLPEDPEQIYMGAGFVYFNNNANSQSTIHSVQAQAAGAATPQYEIPLDHTFNYDNPDGDAYIIICKQESQDGEINYFLDKIHVGYDPSNPEYSVTFDPETIEDEFSVETSMDIQSTDDYLACEYNYLINPLPGQDDITGELPEFTSIESIYNYSRNKSHLFDFPGKTFEINQNYTFTVQVDCHNPAMRHTTKQVNYYVELSRDLDVELEKDYFTTKSPELNFTSSLFAVCSYAFEDDDGFIDGSSPKEEHLLQLQGVDEGLHSIDIHCETIGLGGVFDETYFFTIDTQAPPAPNLSANPKSCGEPYIEVEITPNSEEDVRYNVSLLKGTEVLSQELHPQGYTDGTVSYLISTAPLLENQTYTWKVSAIDKGGLQSSFSSLNVQVTPFEGLSCDFNPPTGNVITNVTASGFEVYVTCSDEETGCTDYFTSSIVELNQTCNYPISTQTKYVNQPLLFDTNKKLCYQVFDKAGNKYNGEKIIAASFDIDLINPKFGIADSKTFSLEVQTNRNAVCKHGYKGEAHPDKLADWYATLEDFSTTGSMIHSTQISAVDYLQLDENLADDQTDWVIICNEAGNYQLKEISPFGFDTTKPIITVKATPNPVIDPGNLKTTLTVTTDDETTCTYLNSEGVPTGFTGYDVEKKSDYTKSHTATISYWGIKEDTEDNQIIKCRNLAQNFNEKDYTIKIEPDDKVQIVINNKEFTNNKNIVLNVTTGQLANCKYRFDDPTKSFESMQTTGSYNHQQAVILSEGEHTLEVYCVAKGTGDEGIKSKTITIDTISPVISILSNTESCSLDALTFSLIAEDDGSGMDYYEYTITGPNSTNVSGKSSDSEVYQKVEMTEGQSYTILVKGFDKAGNTNQATKTMTASSFDPLTCDTTPPKAGIETSAVWEGYHATITCKDETECSDQFTYILDDKNCNLSQMAENYDNQPKLIQESTTMCFTVYDLAGNSDSSHKVFDINEQCYNQIEDPDEKGVDCGGPCLAECGTCNNGKQDRFEKGIDCGGVCETINDCGLGGSDIEDTSNTNQTDEPYKQPQDKECTTDLDCGPDYICNYNYECELDTTITPTYTDNSGINILGLVLLILGLLMIAGGTYYIYYSITQKAEEQRQQEIRRQQMQSQQVGMSDEQRRAIEARKAAEAKRLEDLKQKHLQQQEALNKHLEERKEKRKSLLGVFDVSETEGEQEEVNEEVDTSKSTENKTIEPPQPPKETKLDDGLDEEYVDVRKLHKNALNDLEKLKTQQDKNTLTPKDTQKPLEEKHDDPRKNIFSELKSLTDKEHIQEQKTQELKYQEPTKTAKEELISLQEKEGTKDSFTALKNMISSSTSAEILNTKPAKNNLLIPNKKVTTDELMSIFTKDVKTFDEHTLISVLNILIEEDKIDISTSRNLLERLAEKGLIPRQKVNTLFGDLVKGK